jgi:hypothetical protein
MHASIFGRKTPARYTTLVLSPGPGAPIRLWQNRRVRRLRIGALGMAAAVALAGAARADAPAPGAGAEVQINLCADPQAIVRALGLAPAGAGVEAWYFETPALDLFRARLVFRLRMKSPRPELTLKVADQACGRVAPLLAGTDGKCEYDLHGADLKGAVSLNRRLDANSARALLDAPGTLGASLSPGQSRFLREGTSAWPLPANVERYGPVRIEAYRAKGKRWVVELWSLPGGERYAEISQKARYDDAHGVRAAIERDLARAGVAPCADQSSQAGAKLRALARQIRE